MSYELRIKPSAVKELKELQKQDRVRIADRIQALSDDPELDDNKSDPYERVKEWLALAAQKMDKDHLNKDSQTGPMIPDEALLIRADQSTQFKHVQKVMEFCGLEGIQIWKIQLAASTPEKEDEDD